MGEDVDVLEPLGEPLAEPVVDPDVDEAVCEAALPEPEAAVPLLAEPDAEADAPVADEDRVTPAPPVGIRLIVVLAGRTSELDGEGSLTKSAMILISVH